MRQVYKGYLIVQGSDGEYYVSLDGHHIHRAFTAAEARKVVDQLA